MARCDFSISITPEAVDVRYTPSARDPRGKLFGFLFSFSTLLLMACALLFLPGKHGAPSMWHDLARAPFNSSSFFGPILFLTVFMGLFGWQTFRYDRAAWASDERFHCDRHAITLERVPWFDFSNRTWRTYTYPLTEVHAIRFAVIEPMSAATVWGIRFRSHGRRWVLPSLDGAQGKAILAGLKAIGADVPDDPTLEERYKRSRGRQFGDTSWMDRSWMERK